MAHARVALAHRPILQVQANCFTYVVACFKRGAEQMVERDGLTPTVRGCCSVLAVCGLCADKVKRDPQDQEVRGLVHTPAGWHNLMGSIAWRAWFRRSSPLQTRCSEGSRWTAACGRTQVLDKSFRV